MVAMTILSSFTTGRFAPSPTDRIIPSGWVDDGGEVLDAEHAEVEDRERAAHVFLRLQFAFPRPRREILHLRRDLRQPFGLRIRTTGVINPPSIATATDTCADLCRAMPLSVKLAFTSGCAISAMAHALISMSLTEILTPAAWPRSLIRHPRRQQVIDLEIDRQRKVRHLHEALRQPLRRHPPHAIQRRQLDVSGR